MSAQRLMKEVGVREFRDHATKYLSGTETVAVSKHGHIIGIYIPMKRDEAKVREAVEQFGRTIEQILEETGMTEDELADIFDLNKPFVE
ncbi:MAG: hypothetical protein ACRDJC_07740 [Thermomicrobiales bacterium]